MNETNETKIAERARELLTERAAQLDADTRRRLAQARDVALAAQPGRPRVWWRYAANGVAAAVIATWLAWVWLIPVEAPRSPVAEQALADLDLLAAEGPEFYVELEFYEWLADSNHAG